MAVAKSLFFSNTFATDVSWAAVQTFPNSHVSTLSARYRTFGPVGVSGPDGARYEAANFHAVVESLATFVTRHAVVARPDSNPSGVTASGRAVAPFSPVLPESAVLRGNK